MKLYRKGNVIRLTHVSSQEIQGAIGFIEPHGIGLYAYISNVPLGVYLDRKIEIFATQDRKYPERSIFLLKIPYKRLREEILLDPNYGDILVK